jgi:hypothetical protein
MKKFKTKYITIFYEEMMYEKDDWIGYKHESDTEGGIPLLLYNKKTLIRFRKWIDDIIKGDEKMACKNKHVEVKEKKHKNGGNKNGK